MNRALELTFQQLGHHHLVVPGNALPVGHFATKRLVAIDLELNQFSAPFSNDETSPMPMTIPSSMHAFFVHFRHQVVVLCCSELL